VLFIKESPIKATPERLFAFHASPGAMERLTPPWEKVKVIEGGDSIRVGARVVLETKLGPVLLRWVAEHVEYDPPHAFADRQVSGPFQAWHHRHEFLPDGPDGSTLRDVVHYEVPLGRLGQVCGGWFVRNKLQKMFDYRHDATRRIVEAGDFIEAPVEATGGSNQRV